jgi:GTP-binding protein HflX
VELAQYEYRLPRLTRMWTHLSRQGVGGVGLRGPGETQLESDRREIGRRMADVRRQLEEVRVHRQQYRNRRKKAAIPVVGIVGYTNAGKSTLLNALAGSDVLVEDKLFATLDPTTRRLRLPGGREILLSDTVGFIRKLPHELIASFRATLEGIEEAALLLHVVDASHPRAPDMISTVESVLTELRMIRAPHLVVWNKIDALSAGGDALILPQTRHRSVAVSAKTAENLPALLSTIEEMLTENLSTLEVVIPYGRYELVSAAYAQGTVESREETGEGVRLRLSVPGPLARRLDEFCLPRSGVKSRGGTGPAGLARARRPLLPLDAAEAQTAEMAPGPKPGNGEAEEVAETH